MITKITNKTSRMTTLLLVVSTLLILALHFVHGATIIYPNGTTMIDFAKELKLRARYSSASVFVEEFAFQGNLLKTAQDLHLSAQGNRIILESPDIHLMCPFDTANISVSTKDLRLVAGHVLVDDLSLANNVIGVPDDRDLELHAYRVVGVAPNGDFFNFTTKTGNLKLGTENAGNLVLDAGPDHAVQISASRLDLQGASLNLTGTHVAFDQIISQSLLINGTLITTTESDVDIVLSPKGNGKIRVGRDLDVRGVALILDNDQISGDKVEGGTIDAITITTLNATTINADFLGRSIALKPGIVLDVSSGVLQLANDQISGDKINGGTIDETTITTLTSTTVKTGTVTTNSGDLTLSAVGSVKVDNGKTLDVSQGTLQVADLTIDNVKIDSNAVEATSGDLELKCAVGGAVRVSEELAIGQLVLAGNTLNTTGLNTNLVLVPHGSGAVKVEEGKTLDLRGVTLLIDNDAISGDKIDGGHIGNITVNELVGHLIKNGMLTIGSDTISSTGDIRLSPAGGKIVKITEPLEVEKLKLDVTTIGTTTGQPVTINNLTCPIATFNRITVGTIDIEGNEITCTGATCDVELSAAGTGDVVLKSDVVISAGKSITGSTSEAVFQTVKTSTVTTDSGDLTLNPTGQNVKIEPGKTLDVTGATLKLDDNAISGDKIEGGSINQIEVKDLRSDDVSVSGRVQVNGSVEVGSGGVETKGGVRDSHAWGSEAVRAARLASGDFGGGLGSALDVGGPMATQYFSGYDSVTTHNGDIGYYGNCFDGRFVYFAPMHETVLRYDTQSGFHLGSSWDAFNVSSVGPGNVAFRGAIYDGRHVYFVPYGVGHGRVLRYDTHASFHDSSSWSAHDASNTPPGSMQCFEGAVFDGLYIYFVPALIHGRVLRYDTSGTFTSSSSWAGFDFSNVNGQNNLVGYSGAVFDGRHIYFVPFMWSAVAYHGKVVRYDTTASFSSSTSYVGFDVASIFAGAKGYCGGVFDGRYVYFVPLESGSYHGRVLRLDTKSDFTNQQSWSLFDAGTIVIDSLGGLEGYRGGLFDGRFVYFVPFHYDSPSAYHGNVLRYDTTGVFEERSSWNAIDASNTPPGASKGYAGVTYDGRFLFFCPYYAVGGYHGRVLRYDTRAPQPRPSIQQIASNKDLFIASDSKVGIGTTSPTEQLHVEGSIKADKIGVGTVNSPSTELDVKGTARIDKVEVAQSMAVGVNVTELGNGESVRVEGGVMAKGGVRDSHAWGSETSRRAKLALALNNGGLGSSIFTGGPMNASFFEGYDASGIAPGKTKGFAGSVFDGRYVYFAPYRYNGDWSGTVLRYDTQLPFGSSNGWAAYDASATPPGSMKGFIGGVFDGKYVYFVGNEYSALGQHGRFLRYDTRSDFSIPSSWTGYDACNTSPGNMKGFKSAAFDGRYLYFSPGYDGVSDSGKVLRYDTFQSFIASSSWKGYDASSTGPGNMKGFEGAVFDGRYVYFVPFSCSSTYHGRVLRHDTQLSFVNPNSWNGYDAASTSPGNMVGFKGAVFDGRYLYFVPNRGSSHHGRVLRYDTFQSFAASISWTGYDASDTGPGNMKGFVGGVFDGRYVYMVPQADGSSNHGRILRYDTQRSFVEANSWSGFDAQSIGPGNTVGYIGGVFDGRHIYFSPLHDGSSFHGRVLRYDTRSPQPRPSIQQIATSSELFIASNGSVGIGTTDPGEKLTVEGGVMAKGGVRDSHAWMSRGTIAQSSIESMNSVGATIGRNAFNKDRFVAYDAGTTDGMSVNAFMGGVFDGRYVYFVPASWPSYSDGGHGNVLRLDTSGEFDRESGWSAFQASDVDGLDTRKYSGGVFADHHVYFVPNGHGNILRYDTRLYFKLSSSWSAFNLGTLGIESPSYSGATTDGRYVYLGPKCGSAFSNIAVRYDTMGDFKNSTGWMTFNMSSVCTSDCRFLDVIFTGRYVFYIPEAAILLRYDSQYDFNAPSSWASYDLRSLGSSYYIQYNQATYDGRFLYLSPQYGGCNADWNGVAIRLDVGGDIQASSSWSIFNLRTLCFYCSSYSGAVYDGRYVYYAPRHDACGGSNYRHARYDTHAPFTASSSWSVIEKSSFNGIESRGFWGSVFDGRYIYYVPLVYWVGYEKFNAHVLRYDTRSPQPRPSIPQIASNKDLFIASDSKVGIGTTSPTEQLHVDGNIKVTGTADVTSTLKQGGYTVPTYRYFRVGQGASGSATTISTDLTTISSITSSFTAISSKIYRFSWHVKIGTVSSYSCYVQCYLYSGTNIISFGSNTAGDQSTGLQTHIVGNTLRKFSAGTVSISMKCRKQGCGSGDIYAYNNGLTVEELEGEEMSHTGSCSSEEGGSIGADCGLGP